MVGEVRGGILSSEKYLDSMLAVGSHRPKVSGVNLKMRGRDVNRVLGGSLL